MKTTVRLEHQLLAFESEHDVHCMLELEAPAAAEDRPRRPFHLALVVDRSGSMAGRKLEVTRECAEFLVRRLAPTDELALITYDNTVEMLAPLAAVDQGQLQRAIGQIHPGNTTNLSGGWLKGFEALKGAAEDGPRKVVLLTDGLANVGVTDPGQLVDMAGGAATAGIGTTTIGFGEDFNEDLLTAMADAGHGNAHYAPTPEAAPGIFAAEFEGLLALVAQNVSLEIRPSGEVQVLSILNEYPQVAVPAGVRVELGDAYAGEQRRLVFELHVPRLVALGVAKVADLVLRYTTLGEQIEMHETTVPLTVNLVATDEAAAAGPDTEVTEEVIVLRAARAKEEARRSAEAGDFDKARTLLQDAAHRLRSVAPGSAQVDELLDQAAGLEQYSVAMAPESYTQLMKKKMRFESRTESQRRGPRRPPSPPEQ